MASRPVPSRRSVPTAHARFSRRSLIGAPSFKNFGKIATILALSVIALLLNASALSDGETRY
ncbi:MAG: hypothetical protein U0X93_13860 [Anaerolineales bacterium]